MGAKSRARISLAEGKIDESFQVSPLDKSANLSIQAVSKLMSAFQIAINGMKITCDYCNYISKGFKRWIWQEDEMSQKKGAKGMPSDGPGTHDPSKSVKGGKVDLGFNKTTRSKKYEGPRKTRP